MFRLLVLFASLTAVLGEGVVLESAYGNEDMAAQATIVREGFVYPGGQIGYGGAGYSYSARAPIYEGVGKFEGPFIGGAGVGGGAGGIGGGAGGIGLQGGYYPQLIGGAGIGGAGIGQGGGIGLEGIQYGGYGVGGGVGGGAGGIGVPVYIQQPKFIGSGIGVGGGAGLGGAGGAGVGGAGIGYGAVGPVAFGAGGGEYINKNVYDEGKKELKDLQFQNSQGKKGEEYEAGQQGFKQGQTAVKDVKGDSGYYSGEEGGKKLNEDEKQYYGGRQFSQEGKSGAEKKVKQGHRKGHVVKGFNKSHSSNESGRTEEFYDEEHDEGGNVAFSGQQGGFGESEGSSFKGAHQDGAFKANQGKQQGHYGSEYLNDNNHGGGEQYGSKKYGGSGSTFGANNGVDEQSLLAHQQSNKFFKHYPKHVPFFSSF